MIYQGGCHCGAVTFEVEADDDVEVEACNCSICSMTGFQHLIVPQRNFRLLSGEDQLITYSFNTGVAKHPFCRICGIKSFYIPRSNPDGVDVNLRCLRQQPRTVTFVEFDGRNWEQHAHTLAHKSR
ncbi:MAG: GFA family protein [Gammaproteobacteria bacterium]|nr:GFA family protein [Gammaproteobacteria bacterium]